MSATNRGSKRAPNDFYPTPKWCVKRLFEALPPLPDNYWLEPAAGNGSIVRAVDSIYPEILWTRYDIDPRFPNNRVEDFLTTTTHKDHLCNVVITNPPYSLAQEFIEHALKWAPIAIMLLRLNFLASEKRGKWFRTHTPDVYVLPNRPSFSLEPGSDATEYAWMIWGMNGGRLQILNTTPLEERRRDKLEAHGLGPIQP